MKFIAIDRSGTTVGRLSVLKRCGTSAKKAAVWKCRCTCGRLCRRSSTYLSSSPDASCGCTKKRIRRDRVGQRFGRLVVMEMFPAVVEHNGPTCRCVCDCGGETIVRSKDLPNGNTVSCGCRKYETFHGRGRAGLIPGYKPGPVVPYVPARLQACTQPSKQESVHV